MLEVVAEVAHYDGHLRIVIILSPYVLLLQRRSVSRRGPGLKTPAYVELGGVVLSAMASSVARWITASRSNSSGQLLPLMHGSARAHPFPNIFGRQKMMKTRSCSDVIFSGTFRQAGILNLARLMKSVSLVRLAMTFSSSSSLLVMFSLEWAEQDRWYLSS